jgi:hypothetical protein
LAKIRASPSLTPVCSNRGENCRISIPDDISDLEFASKGYD